MNSFLLDTHTFLWSLNAEEKLVDTARELLSMPENPVYVSSVTFLGNFIENRAAKINSGKLFAG